MALISGAAWLPPLASNEPSPTSIALTPLITQSGHGAARPHDGSDDRPDRVAIPALGAVTELVPVGVDAGELILPDSLTATGWWRKTVAPGSGYGSALLATHKDSPEEVGPWGDLAAVPVGSAIVVHFADTRYRYEVTRVSLHPGTGPLPAWTVRRTGPARVVLISCGGRLLTSADGLRHWADRVLVTARLVTT